ncbi:MAG: EFR1 family ferrodoxin [Spirochaetes bacterium]|nr:EFR1 family ferrodoxin [Spirochaetota bacterium]
MKKYNKVIIYYFTGTGNALKAGRWICKEAEKRNIDVRMYAIDDNYKANPDEIDSKTLIGFLSPTHGFNIAPAMLKFIVKFPTKIKADVFILNTRAGLKLFKIFLPGLSGAAQFLPMIILKLKGYNIIGGLPLDMPSNWLFVHPGLNSATVNSIANRCEKITKKFTRNILYGNKVFRKMIITLPIDIAILPITFIYYVYARFIFAKTMIYTSNCNSCMICVNNCPVKAIKIVNNRPYWSYSCESCMRCINICPCASIQTSHLIFIMILIIPGFLFSHFLAGYIKLPDFLNYGFVLSIIEMAITLVELFILYAVIQRFLKYKFIGSLFKYTSFSAYWRRYRAPGISVKDFKKHATEMKNH